MIQFLGSLPPIQSAIRFGGEEGDCVRIQFDCFLTAEQIAELVGIRGKELTISIQY